MVPPLCPEFRHRFLPAIREEVLYVTSAKGYHYGMRLYNKIFDAPEEV
jgi:hypothetical protein